MGKSSSNIKDIEALTHQAIAAAASSCWLEAVKFNKQILRIKKENVEALNRLAKAQSCLGKINSSQRLYKKALRLDPYNIIARKNLEKISKSNGNGKQYSTNQISNGNINSTVNLANLFLFEPGITKLINLLNLAPPQILTTLNCGEEVLLNPKKHSVTVTSISNVYLGALPDDLAYKLIAFIEGGNKYVSYIKCSTIKSLTVFIREMFRSEKFIDQPSFTLTQNPYLEE